MFIVVTTDNYLGNCKFSEMQGDYVCTMFMFQNPAPGLQVFKPPLPYSEVDEDYHLCPLPRNRTAGKSGKQGRKYLERQASVTDP